jgi:hypothetical protein
MMILAMEVGGLGVGLLIAAAILWLILVVFGKRHFFMLAGFVGWLLGSVLQPQRSVPSEAGAAAPT